MPAKKNTRRTSIQSALDSWLDASPPPAEAPSPPEAPPKKSSTRKRASSSRPRAPEPAPPPPPAKIAKSQATFQLPSELLEQARDTVVHLSGPPACLTLAALVESGIRRELQALQKKHNGGKPFPPRPVPLRAGRPIGS